ncbi:hypothetical protein V5O48_003148 [Marasmius crinis-equi]|uniref:Uncharacterized protein n=1 Tax=Marasmius crinis-equi TaxID=585013 RepID=A0ABR3FU80_9AGAR
MISSDDSEHIGRDADESFHGYKANERHRVGSRRCLGETQSFVEKLPLAQAQVADNKHGRLLAAIRLNPDSTDSDGDFDSENEGESLEIEDCAEEKVKRRERRNGMFLPWGLI